ncbi:hypothetical protein FPD38_01665 [Campylobacter volucris]|uniref:Periplasmic protein n=1 Tax=Campylobacter volucris TaxID=1031542 RepID=A0A5C7E4T5_9BACT|nr:hypothetical protein [Campylobacter volucris]TXE89431.1 hypothetical protein FPD38_01665 [Campylobacter volucris]
MRILFLFFVISFSYADIYETLNDFAYNKQNSINLYSKEATILELKKDKKSCVDIVLSDKKAYVLKKYDSCKDVNETTLNEYLNTNFMSLYLKDLTSMRKELSEIKNIMRDFMIYYTLNHSFANDLKLLSKSEKIHALNLDKNTGGKIFYKINDQDCVMFDLFLDEFSQASLYVVGIENLDKQCMELISSPEFKELSFTQKEMKKYRLKN